MKEGGQGSRNHVLISNKERGCYGLYSVGGGYSKIEPAIQRQYPLLLFSRRGLLLPQDSVMALRPNNQPFSIPLIIH